MEEKDGLTEIDIKWVRDVAFNEFNGKSDEELGDRCVNCISYGKDGVCGFSGLLVERTDCCWLFKSKVLGL